MDRKGKFIVFEGIDCCGKTTQLRKFADFLYSHNKYNHLILTREPYQSRAIRTLMQTDTEATSNKEKCSDEFIADRKTHIKEVISPNMEKGLIILDDRYKYSTLCYQTAQGMLFDDLVKAHEGMPVPDLAFIFDVPVNIARKRMGLETRVKEGKFENDINFQKRLRELYLLLPRLLPEEPILILNGVAHIDAIAKDIQTLYFNKFPEEKTSFYK